MPRDAQGNWVPLNMEAERVSAATLHQSISQQTAGLVNGLLNRLEDAAMEIAELRQRNAVLDAAVTAPVEEPKPKAKRANARQTAAAEKANRREGDPLPDADHETLTAVPDAPGVGNNGNAPELTEV